MAARTKGKRRAPLMESDTEAALRRRGTELVGLILIALAALAAAMLWTYSPDDPSLFSATDAAPVNALGLVGASLADPLHRALGWAAYGIATALAVWGLRFLLHAGEARAVGRSITLPVALLAAAAFAATHVPPDGWRQDYGLGGLLGDASLGALISISPFDLTATLRLASLLLAAAFAASAGYALGVTWAEARGFLRFLLQGSVLLYAGAHGLGTRAASGAAEGARAAASFAAEQRARHAAPAPAVQPAAASDPRPAAAPRPTADDSLMAKITEAVRARREAEGAWPPPGRRTPPPLTSGANALAVVDEPDPLEAALSAAPEPRVQPAKPGPLPKSARARSEEQPELALDPNAPALWQTPPLSLLQSPSTIVRHHLSSDSLEENARMLETVLDDYGVRGEITSIRPGPVVTLYELEPAAGLKASAASSASPTTSPARCRRSPAASRPSPAARSSASSCRTTCARRCCCARSSPPAPSATRPTPCRSPSARTSAASPWSPTSPACRTC